MGVTASQAKIWPELLYIVRHGESAGGHSVVVLCLRYLIEHMTEEQILR